VELLTEKEAAIIAKVHPRTIRRLISGGKLPALNFGNGGRRKVYRIDPAALLNVQPVHLPLPRERHRRSQLPASIMGGVKLRD
jgi:excisionase family DNA binding protein